jgi:hypothetical protein
MRTTGYNSTYTQAGVLSPFDSSVLSITIVSEMTALRKSAKH